MHILTGQLQLLGAANIKSKDLSFNGTQMCVTLPKRSVCVIEIPASQKLDLPGIVRQQTMPVPQRF